MDDIIKGIEYHGDPLPEGWTREVIKDEDGLRVVDYTDESGNVQRFTGTSSAGRESSEKPKAAADDSESSK